MADEKAAKGGGGDDAAAKPKREKKEKKVAKVDAGPVPTYKRTAPPRLKTYYAKEVAPALMKEFSFTNPMQVPRLLKVTVNMGLGEAVANPKVLDTALEDLRSITGQQPVATKSKKAIANFKLREGLKIGAMVTLRRAQMWEFVDRLVSLALPRVRDFKGVSPKGFDGRGNYTLGLRDQLIFPEIDYMKVDKSRGMNVSVVTTAKTDEEARRLLQLIGMPFRAS
jgi:large subunit ribosomal protein L5